MKKQGFQRLRRNLQYPLRVLNQPLLCAPRGISVPLGNPYIRALAKPVEALKLVVDESLQGRNVEHADRSRGLLREQG